MILITEVDKAAEQAVIEILHRAYPGHAILAENPVPRRVRAGDPSTPGSSIRSTEPPTFIHGFPAVRGVDRLKHKGVLAQGVIYDPTKNELFTATRGARRLSQRAPHPDVQAHPAQRGPHRPRDFPSAISTVST